MGEVLWQWREEMATGKEPWPTGAGSARERWKRGKAGDRRQAVAIHWMRSKERARKRLLEPPVAADPPEAGR